jgi:hypothetical protein
MFAKEGSPPFTLCNTVWRGDTKFHGGFVHQDGGCWHTESVLQTQVTGLFQEFDLAVSADN